MTALEIAKNVAASIGFQVPSTLRSNQDPNARLMLLLVERGVRLWRPNEDLDESWAELTREAIITTIEGQRDYPLPQGFANLITATTSLPRIDLPAGT